MEKVDNAVYGFSAFRSVVAPEDLYNNVMSFVSVVGQ